MDDESGVNDMSDFSTREEVVYEARLQASLAVFNYPDAIVRTHEEAKKIARVYCREMWKRHGKRFTNDFDEFTRLHTETFATAYLQEVAKKDKQATAFTGTVFIKTTEHQTNNHTYQLHLVDASYLKKEVQLLLTVNDAGEIIQIEET